MKIGSVDVPGLAMKPLASGRIHYRWEPSPRQRRAGWKGFKIETDDLAAAITACRRQSEKIAEWEAGGARPRQVRAFAAPETLAALLDRYERDVLAHKSANTRRVDKTALKHLREWAGKHPVRWITRARVKALRDALMRGVDLNGPGHATAFHILATGRKIVSWWIDEDDLDFKNPFERFALPMPAPRDQIWEADARAAFAAAADAAGLHSLALAFEIATYVGQREADVLAFDRSRWREISLDQLGHDQPLYDALAAPDGPSAGKVMGIYVRQNKTARWVGVPVEGALRVRIEAAFAASLETARQAGKVPPPQLLINENTGRPWGQSDFIHKFAEVRAAAAAKAAEQGNSELAQRMKGLQFRDLRRTCIVALGALGLNDYIIGSISGHTQATIKKILETYMPRTEAGAARGIVARIGHNSQHAAPEEKEQQG